MIVMKINSKIYFIGVMLLFVFFTSEVLASAIKGIPVTTKSSKAKELLIKARDARELGNLLMAQEFCKKPFMRMIGLPMHMLSLLMLQIQLRHLR